MAAVDGDFVVIFDKVDQMVRIISVEISNTKVVDAKGECGTAGPVAPESRSVLQGFVAKGAEFSDKLFESNGAGFLETIHASADFEVNTIVVVNSAVVFAHYFVRN